MSKRIYLSGSIAIVYITIMECQMRDILGEMVESQSF